MCVCVCVCVCVCGGGGGAKRCLQQKKACLLGILGIKLLPNNYIVVYYVLYTYCYLIPMKNGSECAIYDDNYK